MPGLVGQVFEIHKSGSVPQVESETNSLGDVKGEGPLRLPLAIFRARQCGLVCSRWLVTICVLPGTSNDESGDGLCACPRKSRPLTTVVVGGYFLG